MRPVVALSHQSIQTRLLIAVSLLALATLIIGLSSLYWLNRSNQILTALHNTTLAQVNRSHELTRQSSVFATSVPFFLNLKSPYLIESEGSKILNMIDSSITSWQSDFETTPTVNNQNSEIVETLLMLRSSMVDLMLVVGSLADGEDQTRRYTAKLSEVNKQILNEKQSTPSSAKQATADQAEVIVSLLFAASHANSLLSLGEYRRNYLDKSKNIQEQDSTSEISQSISTMNDLAVGENGLFNTRYKVLQHNISTHRALSNISSNVNTLSNLVLDLIQRSENDIASRRMVTSDGLKNAIVLVAIVGLGAIVLAAISALYISGYVVRNLNTVTTAMTALADGNLKLNLPVKGQREDEIGRLSSAFNVFQKNAFNLSRLNRQLAQKTAQFESTFNNINDGVSITGSTGLVLANNPRLNQLLSLFGNEYEVSVGSNLEDKIVAISEHTDQPTSSFTGNGYTELRNKLGQIVEVRTSTLPDGGHVWLFSDTTERRRVEEKLRHFQRLESLGQLTGEVAHDVNNVLSAIQTTVPRILSSRKDKALHKAAVDRINDAVELGSSLTHRLLAFAKRQQLEPKTIELNELVSGVSDLISLSMGERIEFIVNESSKKTYVTIDPLQLESALLNLCLNSAHAIDGHGKVTISIGETSAQLAYIQVVDSGCGMSEDVVSRAIEPFFSTQQGSSGSGLGLSIVYGFIKQSGGDLQITSAPGEGTKVKLFIPVSDSKTLYESKKTLSGIDNSTVLIVENCMETLKWAVKTLRGLGLQTIEASDADTALGYIESNIDFSILFTDLHLGGSTTGWDLARQLLRINPDMRIIVTSGRFNHAKSPPTDLAKHVSLLNKPYTQSAIAQLLYKSDD